ncbi:hypothetical protein PPTG_14486 [Phytophthora nicotianae INRA-310]|uniref:BHLH domain-containing protein n=2 Tax=Phytophthora nicotianae TaxID=4792 RepID=W2PUK9_PHYN3|nr:hypothetical protein PPTG_14486 [Phytophthora nicotianae INRA-310]ETN04668.1 hypothetical protein PPTG_14486 [Phytophthora nicotianae INRA-310]ETO68833.1 hypothetical protein F444_14419 [Phytophthora nicotianae P1976]
MREQVNMALLDDDDAFEAALTFLDEYEFEEAKAEDFGTPGGHHEAAQTKGKSFGSFANPVPKTCTMPSKAPTESWSSDGKLRRKKALNEEREILRKTGVYGDPNRSRNERKKEIAFLREQLQKLQLDLRALQSRAAERSHEKTADTEESGCVMALIPKVWQEMAVHQRRRRQEAEHENIHLKLVVEQQQKVADNLCSLLRKRSTHLVSCKPLLVLCAAAKWFT